MKLCPICKSRGIRTENPTAGHLLGHRAAGVPKTITPALLKAQRAKSKLPRKPAQNGHPQNGNRN